MHELSAHLLRWHAANNSYALATVIEVTGSAPRPVGATMAVNDAGATVGSISAGCVEGAVSDLCQQVLKSGRPARETFGYSDSDAFAVGLTCGGQVAVFVHPVRPTQFATVEAAMRPGDAAALVRDLATGVMQVVHSDRTVGAPFGAAAVRQARAMLELGATGVRTVGDEGRETTIFVQSFAPPPRMIIFGATDFAAALCRVGRLLGYRVTVCDARPVFADTARLPDANEVVLDWPHRYLRRTQLDARTVVCVLTHEPKFDIPALRTALRLPLAYVGALGSRRADAERRTQLRASGLTDTELALLHSPIGLDLGGRTPEETAVAIGAEIVAIRHGGSTQPLSRTDRAIHGAPEQAGSSGPETKFGEFATPACRQPLE
ncbi:XdhC family protein [Nocardia sp. NBC_00565]|uniref:XdhC family protein n=1 Tax=Nocardia sp. NBC_00565 TaxID=2975993 RepID=UPI002E81AF66|nr:XdhC family protein [Nocardia sp. NBC_00565]WUC05859.1 XdhC family protein [Nocardia sp. NBC_00565]